MSPPPLAPCKAGVMWPSGPGLWALRRDPRSWLWGRGWPCPWFLGMTLGRPILLTQVLGLWVGSALRAENPSTASLLPGLELSIQREPGQAARTDWDTEQPLPLSITPMWTADHIVAEVCLVPMIMTCVPLVYAAMTCPVPATCNSLL